MKPEEVKRRLHEERPDAPLGFETRIDAKMNELTGKGTMKMKKMRWTAVLAMAMVVCMMIGGAVSFASGGFGEPGTISPVLDKDAHMTETSYYNDNTVCVAGISMRDRHPGMTELWYNVVPVDLTVQGRQTYKLIASNMYYIGECYVDVAGDSVTVTYATYRGNLKRLSEHMNWFIDEKDITADALKAELGGYAFGEKVSISQSLKGAKTALLFVCNHVDYKNPYGPDGASLVRYWPNKEDWKSYREGLETLMQRVADEVVQRRIEEEERIAAEQAAAEKAAAEKAAAEKAAAEQAAAEQAAAEQAAAEQEAENADPEEDSVG